MTLMHSCLVLLLVCFIATGSGKVVLTDAEISNFLRLYPNANFSVLDLLPDDIFEVKADPYVPPMEAACPTIPVPPDTNDIRNLRPGNIRVVLAMGDSVTAGMSAKDTSIISLKEYRGLSYAIGGDAGLNTLPNLLKPYVPTGYPIGASIGIGERNNVNTGLNGAVSGAINSDMLSQAQWLVSQMKANTKINYANDWKILSIWIGSNNLCDVCDNQNNNNGANFETNVITALEFLYQNVPRLFVNLVANLEISGMYNINSGACSLLHSFACGCVGSSNAKDRQLVKDTGLDYQKRAITIAAKFNSRGNSNFTVVVQPFLTNTLITDRSQLSAADCFHPSAASHATAAVALWNNLLTPAGQKKTTWGQGDSPLCPTVDSLFYVD